MLILLTFILILTFYFLIDYYKVVSYWKNKNVKFVFPIPFFGSFTATTFGKESLAELITKLYNSYSTERYFGVFQFHKPVLLIKDPDLIKKLTIKEFDSFSDHFNLFTPDVDPLWGNNLFASQGEKWKDMRQTLSPVFTSKKMKTMFKLMDDCSKNFIDHLKNHTKESDEYEAKDILSKFATDVIGSTAFGITCNSLKDQNNDFVKYGQELTDFSGFKKMKLFLAGMNPKILKMLDIKMVSSQVGDFFRKVIGETIETREKSKIVRPDLIHLLMEARKGRLHYEEEVISNDGYSVTKESELGKRKSDRKIELTDDDVIAQALIFLFGGYDTTSTLMVFTLYELMVNPNIQDKLREEMLISKDSGTITYEKLLGMKYLDMVVSESLRKWPNAQFIDRVSNKEFTIEPECPGENPLVLQSGTSIWIPIFAIHRDEKYYSNPDKFDPERFNNENKSKILPSTFLPFGSGPRNCIGSRYALLVTKLLFYYLLTNFEILPTNNTKIPLRLSKSHLNLTSEGGLFFSLRELDK